MRNALRLILPFVIAATVNQATARPDNGMARKQVIPTNMTLPGTMAPAALSKSPLSFIENKGQVTDQDHNTRKDIQFRLGAANGLSIFVGDGAIHYQFSKADNPEAIAAQVSAMQHPDPTSQFPTPNSGSYTMYRMDVELVGANKHAKVVTEQEQDYHENYFTPGTGDNGATAHAYNRITYKDVYPHIDWVLYTSNGQLKHEFIVKQGGKVSDIKLKYGGATGLNIDSNGNLTANTPQGSITENSPYTYQHDGKKVTSSFKLNGDVLSYEAGDYTGDLVIDPALEWATYFGGSSVDEARGVTTDASGNVFMCGVTYSTAGIATTGAFLTSYTASQAAFLAALNTSGVCQWATYYGGNNLCYGQRVATDATGNVYLAGFCTSTSGISTTGSQQAGYGGGSYDCFLVKFNGSGARQWATYYGGSGSEIPAVVAVDGSGNVYLAGSTSSTSGMATTGSYNGGGSDAFLAQFNSSGVRQWGVYYGGNGDDYPYSIALSPAGTYAYLSGYTSSTSGIATTGTQQTTFAGGSSDAFLVQFNSSGIRQWGTYYGGSGDDEGNSVTTDATGNVYLAGNSNSASVMASSGAYQTAFAGGSGVYDNYVAQFNSSGVRQWGTYYGGTGDDRNLGVATDGSGNVYIAGPTSSTAGIATVGAYQTTYGGGSYDGFLAEFSSTGSIITGTYFGNNDYDAANAMAIDASGSIYLAGGTNSAGGIATSGAYQTTLVGGGSDAFLAKFNCGPAVSAITGNTTICAGSKTTLADTATGGTWSSSNTGIATVGSTGIVTGVANGTVTITYKASNACGSNKATAKIFVGSYVTTIAGMGGVFTGYSGDNGPATAAQMVGPWKAITDNAGNMYISDQQNDRIRKVSAAGIITTIAGTGSSGSSGDGGPATAAKVSGVYGMALDAAGNLYLADHNNGRVRMVNTSGIMSTFAGGGGSSADGIPATNASLGSPMDIAVDAAGNILITDGGYSKIRKVSPSGIITTIAGTSTPGFSGDGGLASTAQIQTPFAMVIDGSGNIYFSDISNYRIRKINTYGVISTVAGNGSPGFSGDGFAATAAKINDAEGMTVDNVGNIYIADYNGNRVRQVNTAGIINTIVGDGTPAYNGDGGAATTELYNPSGLFCDPTGTLYISDHSNRVIRTTHSVLPNPGIITGNTNVCVGNTTQLTDAAATGITGTWSSGNSAIATVSGTGLVTGISNGIVAITYIASNGCGSAITTASVNVGVPVVTTVAGNGISGSTGDSGPAIMAELSRPWGIAKDPVGNTYVSDYNNSRVRKISPSGIITTFAGTGTSGFSGDNGPATAAKIGQPFGIATDATGNVYIATTFALRKVSTAGVITTVCGNGTSGGSTGDNGPASSALVSTVTDVKVDVAGNIYIADAGINKIRKISTSGIITTVAGNGATSHGGDGLAATSAQINNPESVAIDAAGNIYIGEDAPPNAWVRKVNTSGIISTIAGGTAGFSGDNGPAATAQIDRPWGLCMDAANNLYIADYNNGRIRMINTSGTITTLAGGGSTFNDGVAATAAQFTGITGVFVDNTGTVYIADNNNNRVRQVSSVLPNPGAITGNTNVCPGNTTTLTDITATGVTSAWSSSNTGVATVGTTGVVTGVSTGTATITFTAGNGCGSNYTTAIVYVGVPVINTIAGNGTAGYSGDGSAATAARINGPVSVAADAAGNIYTADQYNNRVRKISPAGIITTIAGTGTATFSGDGFAATNATLNSPRSVALDAAGNLYIADEGNLCIRKVSTSGIISTVAGKAGISGSSGDGFAATAATFTDPLDVKVDGSGNIYIADGARKVRKVNTSGIISTFAGNGGAGHSGDGFAATLANIDIPNGIAIDPSGNLYIAENNAAYIRKVNTSGIISTIAGTGTPGFSGDGFAATAAQLKSPWGLATDAVGNVYVADESNNRIRQINSSGIINTVAGGGSSLGDGGVPTLATLFNPIGLAFDPSGNMYIGDFSDYRIRKVNSLGPSSGVITGTVSVCPGNTGALTDATTGGAWSSGNTGIATVGSTGVVTGVASGTTTISYTVAGGCGSNPATMTVTVNPVPAAISGAGNICMGGTSALSDAGGGTWSSSNTLLATVNTSGLVSPVAVGTPTITYTNGAGCYITKQVTITPAASAIGGTPSVCAGGTTALTNSAGAWSTSNSSLATVNSSGLVTGVAAGTPTITFTLGTGCAATLQVTVNTAPGSITGTATVCENAATALSDAGGGAWSSSNTTRATVNSSGVVNGVLAGTATITYTLGTGCFSAQSVTVLPAPSAISGTGVVCVGLTTSLSDAGGGTWSSGNTGLATVSSSGVVTGVGAGTPAITYTIGSGCMVATTVSVNASPGAITGSSSVCVSATTALSDAGGGAWSSGNTGLATVNSSGVVTGVAVGAPTITYALGTGCMATQVVTVISAASPVTGTTSVCVGLTTSLSDAGGGAWTSGNTSQATVTSSGVVSGIAAGNPVITYTLGSGCTATTIVTVNAAPGAITGTPVVCAGVTTALSDGGGGAWTSGNSSLATVNSLGVVTGISAGTATISYTLGTGCLTTIPVTVNPQPVAGSVTGITTVCAGLTTTLTDAAPGGTWSSGGTNAAVTGGVVTGVLAGTAVIRYTVTNSCNTAVATTTVTINPLPNAGAILSASTVCAGSAITLVNAAPGGVWSVSNTSASVSGTALTGVKAGVDTIIYTVTNSCGVATATATITVNPLPVPGSISGSSALCVGANITLTDAAPGGVWSSTGTVAAVTGGVVTGVSKGTSVISYTVSVTCGTAAATKTITVNPLPDPGVMIASTAAICAGATTTMTDDVAGGTWSTSNTGVATAAFGSVTGVAAGTVTISYTVTNGCGSASATRALTVTPPFPNPGTITGTGAICMGSATALTDPATGGTWTSINTAVATVSGTGFVTSVAPGSANINYSISNSCGTAVASMPLTVNPLPVSGAITGLSSVCSGLSVSLTDAAPGGVWSSNATSVATVTSGGLVNGVTTGIATISYTVINSCGTSTATIPMTVNAPFPTVTGISGGGAFCAGHTVSLSDTTAGGVWTTSATSVATVSSTGDVSGVGAGTATISYSLTSSCGTASATRSIVVGNLPAIYNVTGGGPLCSDTTSLPVGLSGSDTGINYRLYSNLYGQVFGADGTGTAMAYGKYLSPDTFTVQAVDIASGCTTLMNGRAIVKRYDKPDAAILGKVGHSATEADTFYVQITNIGTGTTYQWYVNGNKKDGATGSSFIIGDYKYHDVVACHMTTMDECGLEQMDGSIVVDFTYDYNHTGVQVSDKPGNNISVVPNPTNGTFTIKGSVAATAGDDLSYELVDMLGQVVYRNSMKAVHGQVEERVSVSGTLANGTYLLRVRSNTEIASFHIVLNR